MSNTPDASLHQRKRDHIKIVLDSDNHREHTRDGADVDDHLHCFDAYQLPYRTLPNTDLSSIDTSTSLLGKQLSRPFIISSMTGWPVQGELINRNLAIAAERAGVWLGLWSMRVVIADPASISTFDVRSLCPSIPLFANVWLVQLNYGFGADECNRIIDAVGADGLFFHLNALQEAVQPEGDTNFAWLIDKLAAIVPRLNAPVYVKEVGNGIDPHTAHALIDAGVSGIDVSGRGGISRPAVEWRRRDDALGNTIRQLGRRTDQSLSACVQHAPHGTYIAGGGLRSGIDVAKSIVMGASYGTAGAPFLKPALDSADHVYDLLTQRHRAYQIALRSCSVTTTGELKNISFV